MALNKMENPKATETNVQPIATGEQAKVLPETELDLEAKNVALEAEKARLIEEAANYKMAYLKEKGKKENFEEDEGEDNDKVRRTVREELANSRLAEIAREQDVIIRKALKENKELKLAHLNKTTTTPPASVGAHSEVPNPVRDQLFTKEQEETLRTQRGWTDKDFERYRKNYQKNVR